MFSHLQQRVVVTAMTALAENTAVGMPVPARQLVCLLLACLAVGTVADMFSNSSAASGLLQTEDAACVVLSRRKMQQQTSSQPPVLPTQEVPFAVWQMVVRLASQTCHYVIQDSAPVDVICCRQSARLGAESRINGSTTDARTIVQVFSFSPCTQDILLPALQQAAQPGRPVSFKTIEAAIYQSYVQVPARLSTCKYASGVAACLQASIDDAECEAPVHSILSSNLMQSICMLQCRPSGSRCFGVEECWLHGIPSPMPPSSAFKYIPPLCCPAISLP